MEDEEEVVEVVRLVMMVTVGYRDPARQTRERVRDQLRF